MPRDLDVRKLSHTSANRMTFSRTLPSIGDMREGESKYIKSNGILYLYHRIDNELHRVQFTKVS